MNEVAGSSFRVRVAFSRACASTMYPTSSSPMAEVRVMLLALSLSLSVIVWRMLMITTCSEGCMEADKAATIGKVLDLEIDPKHVILSHTPMQELAERFRG